MSDSNFSAIRARLKYESIEEFIAGYARFISAGGMFIPMAPAKLKPIGTTIRFQFLLGDGATALLGEGVVVQVRPPEEGNPTAPVGMLIKFSKLSQESKNLVDQIVAMKEFGSLGSASDAESESEAEAEEEETAAEEAAAAAAAREHPEADDPTYEMNLQEFMALHEDAKRSRDQEDAAQSETAPGLEEETGQAQETVEAPEDDEETPEDVEEETPEVEAPDEEAAEERGTTRGPRQLAQTEGGLQILAFDDISDEEAHDLEFDLGAQESDIDEMFAGLFGSSDANDDMFGGVFGGGDEAEEEPADEAVELDEESAPEEASEPELVLESEPEFEDAEEEELEFEEEEEALPLPAFGEGASLTFPDDWSEAESADEEPDDDDELEEHEELEDEEEEELEDEDEDEELEDEYEEEELEDEYEEEELEDAYEEEELEDEELEELEDDFEFDEMVAAVSEDEAFEDESEPVDDSEYDDDVSEDSAVELVLESDAVELIEGSEAEMLLEEVSEVPGDSEAADDDPEPMLESFDEFSDFEPPEDSDEDPPSAELELAGDDGPSELENLLGNLESDPAEDPHEMDLHLANDPLADFEHEEPVEPAEPIEEDDEESLDFLLAAANAEIAAKRADEPEDDGEGDILDDLLGDVANLPPPPEDQPVFGGKQEAPKKKKGFLSKLFGKD